MSKIDVTLGGVELRRLEIPFLRVPIENARDVETEDGSIHTDFVSLEKRWELNYARLTKEEYDDIYDVYTSQFESGDYPKLTIDYYNVNEVPVRMTINEKDIRNYGQYIENVAITLRETEQLSTVSLDSS